MAVAAKILKKLGKILGFFIGGLLVFVLVLLFSLNFLLQTSFFTKFALDTALPPLEKLLCAKLAVKSLRMSFLPFSLDVEGVLYTDPQQKYAQPFASLQKLSIRVKTAPLLRGQVVVSEIAVIGAQNYLFLRRGLENLPICPSKPKPPKPPSPPFKLKLPIVVENMHVDAVFAMDMPSTTPHATPEKPEPKPSEPLKVTVGAINIDGTADLNVSESALKIRIDNTSFAFGELKDKIESIAIDYKINMADWKAEVPRFEVQMPDAEINLTAQATNLLDDISVNADLGLTVDLRKVNQLILTKPKDIQLSGPLTLAAKYGLKLGKHKMAYVADGTLSMPDAKVNELHVRDLNAAFTVTPETAKLPKFQATIGTGLVNVSGNLGLTGEMPLDGAVDIADLDVGDAMRRFGIGDQGVAAILNTDLTATGRLKDLNVDTQGRILLRSVKYAKQIQARQVDVNLDANVGASTSDVRDLKVVVSDLTVSQGEIPQINLAFRGLVGPTQNIINKLLVTTAQTTIEVAGKANPKGALDLKLDVQMRDLGEFAGLVGKKLAGRGGLQAKVGGTAKKPDVRGNLAFQDIVFDTIAVQKIGADLAFVENKASVSHLRIESDGTVITADAAYDMRDKKQPRATAKLQLLETPIKNLLVLAGQAEKMKVDGTMSLNVDVDGPVDKLTGQVKAEGKMIEAFGEKVEALTLDAHLASGVIVLDELSLIKNRNIRPIFLRGLWRPKPEKQITEEDRQPAVIAISGKVDPQNKTFALKIASQRLTEMASDTVARDKLHLMADAELMAEMQGAFDDPHGSLKLTIQNGRYEHLDLGNSVIEITAANHQLHATGVLLDGRQQVFEEDTPVVKPTTPQTSAIDSTNPAPNTDTPPAKFNERFGGEQTEDDFAPAAPAPVAPTANAGIPNLGRIKLEATLSLEGDMALNAKLKIDRFDYSNFLKEREQVKRLRKKSGQTGAAEEEEQQTVLGGRVDGEITISGHLKKKAAGSPATEENGSDLAATVRFDEILFQHNDFIIRNQDEKGKILPIVIVYKNGEVDVEDFALGGSGVRIDLDRTDLRGEPFFVLNAEVEMSVAKAFTDKLTEASGHLWLWAEVPVKFDLGKVVADVKIPDADFVVQNMPTPIDNLNLLLRFEDRTATIKKLTAEIGGGTLEGGGTFKLPTPEAPPAAAADNPTPVGRTEKEKAGPKSQLDMVIKLKDVRTGYDPNLELLLKKVDLMISSRPDGKMDISGEVNVTKAVISKDIDIITILKAFQKPRGGVSGSETYEKKEESVYFNIVVRADRNVLLDNNFAQMEFKMDLLLTGNNVETGMIGTVEVLKGNAAVLQNNYQLSSGIIQFFDETRIFPAFDINAVTEVSKTKVFINVSGTPERYQISFTSDPPKSERDIVALLSLGVSYEEAQSGGSAISGDEAAAMAAQQLVGRQFHAYTGLDIGTDTSTGVGRFKISKELQKDLSFSLFRGISDQTMSSELEYDFVRYMAVYGEWSNFAGQENVPSVGGYGAGIRVKIEFR